MRNLYVLTAFALVHPVVSGCGLSPSRQEAPPPAEVTFGAQAPAADYEVEWMRGSAGGRAAPAADLLEARAHHRYAVPPDRALVRATVRLEAPTRGGVTAAARDAVRTLRDALTDGERCEATVTDLSPPAREDQEVFSEEATLRLDVVLRGLPSVEERQAAIEGCLARFEDTGVRAARIVVSDPLLTVDDPTSHRAALLEQALEGVRAVTAADVSAATCRSNGHVTIVERSLSEIALAIDLTCA